jgi:hypothetical protein
VQTLEKIALTPNMHIDSLARALGARGKSSLKLERPTF